jgi:hypothetical protein
MRSFNLAHPLVLEYPIPGHPDAKLASPCYYAGAGDADANGDGHVGMPEVAGLVNTSGVFGVLNYWGAYATHKFLLNTLEIQHDPFMVIPTPAGHPALNDIAVQTYSAHFEGASSLIRLPAPVSFYPVNHNKLLTPSVSQSLLSYLSRAEPLSLTSDQLQSGYAWSAARCNQ